MKYPATNVLKYQKCDDKQCCETLEHLIVNTDLINLFYKILLK